MFPRIPSMKIFAAPWHHSSKEFALNSAMSWSLVIMEKMLTTFKTGIYGAPSFSVSSLLSSSTVQLQTYLDSDSFLVLVFSVFGGAIFVTFNIRVLGGGISFFQSVAILGYCVCPLLIMIFVDQLLRFFQIKDHLIRFILLAVGVVWSIFGTCENNSAARAFISVSIPKDRKFVALYPIILFYSFLGLLMSFQWFAQFPKSEK